MRTSKVINVNELQKILSKHFNAKWVYVKKVRVGNPGFTVTHRVGAGRICNLEVEVKPKQSRPPEVFSRIYRRKPRRIQV